MSDTIDSERFFGALAAITVVLSMKMICTEDAADLTECFCVLHKIDHITLSKITKSDQFKTYIEEFVLTNKS